MPLNRWGDMPIENAILRLDKVSEQGFTVTTFDGSESTDVEFEFVVLRSD
jgi:hypothetical protein